MASCCKNTTYGTYIGCGVYCPWSCGTSIQERDVELASTLDVPLCVSAKAADETFTSLSLHVKHLQHLPGNSTHYLLHLIYLAGLEGTKSPYTKSEISSFKISHEADLRTRTWLQCGLISGLILIAGSCGLGVKAVSDWKEGQNIFLPLVGSLFCGISGVIVSWVATGSNPDFASNSANVRQDKLSKLNTHYEMIAAALIELKYNNIALAKCISQKLSIAKIQEFMHRDDPKADQVLDLFSLEAAICHVNDMPIPARTPYTFKSYIKTLEKTKDERKE